MLYKKVATAIFLVSLIEFSACQYGYGRPPQPPHLRPPRQFDGGRSGGDRQEDLRVPRQSQRSGCVVPFKRNAKFYPTASQPGSQVDHGSFLLMVCEPGYSARGGAFSFCQNGAWSDFGECVANSNSVRFTYS